MAETQEKITLTCREAQLVLKLAPPGKAFKELKPEEYAAIEHYAGCASCRSAKGLAEIIGRQLTCQEALEFLAENPGPRYLGHTETVLQELAVEHVWGRYIIEPETSEGIGRRYRDSRTACRKICQALDQYWGNAHLNSSNDGEREVAKQIPFSIKLFRKLNWPVTELLRIQKARISALLDQLESKELHKHERDWIIFEIKENLAVLQRLLDPKATSDTDSR